ncbi:MAG: SDR family NAD(P)-dependent oxidoreductase [Cyclobacteriaceae bacterium]
MKPIAFITGATSGIGEACAKYLADKYYLIICGRRADRLESLAKGLQVKTAVHTLTFDVSDRAATMAAIESLPDNWKEIDVLINNAGNAHGLDLIHEGNVDDWDAMIDINVKGLLYVSKAVLPGMVTRGHGHVINIGSIAGVESYRKGAVYNASKFAVDAISQGMRRDLVENGIKVSEIKPGLVETEFSLVRFKGDEEKAKPVYEGIEPLYARDIADAVMYVVTRPKHVNIADMLILPLAQAGATLVHRNKD